MLEPEAAVKGKIIDLFGWELWLHFRVHVVAKAASLAMIASIIGSIIFVDGGHRYGHVNTNTGNGYV